MTDQQYKLLQQARAEFIRAAGGRTDPLEFFHGLNERENPPTQFERAEDVLKDLSDKPRPASADTK